MRDFTTNFQRENSQPTIEPRYTIAVYFADADVSYFTSHTDALTPAGVAAEDLFSASIMRRGISGTTQKIDFSTGRFSIGTLAVQLSDAAGDLSDKINTKLGDDKGLRYKKVEIYKGLSTLTAWSDYALVATYIITAIEYNRSVYTLRCSDVQRIAKTEIFAPHQGVLTSTISADADEIPVTIDNASEKFPLVEHDTAYSTQPSDSVGYIKLEDEIIAHDGWTDGTYTKLNVIERGAFNTIPVRHVVTELEVSKRKKIEEYVYLEGNAVRLAYYLLSGKDALATLADLPDHWHAGIPEAYLETAEFTGIGSDLWDTTAGTGRPVRFLGEEPVDAKKFIETEIMLWLGCFMPVRANGALGLRRHSGTLPESAYVLQVDDADIVRGDALKHDMKSLVNNIQILWNWNARLERYLKLDGLVDANSITRHGQAPLKTFEFKGVFLGVHSDADIRNFTAEQRDRFANPPIRRDITVIPELEVLEVGDTIRVIDSECRDYNSTATMDRAMMVTQVRNDWVTGLVTLSLFGGIEKAVEESLSETHVLADGFYDTTGTELSTVLTISGDAITANGTLNGGADNGSNIFYYEGNLTLNAGVTLTINRNVQLRIRGTFTVNGTIDLEGNSADGELGATNTGYSVQAYIWHVGQDQDESGAFLSRYLAGSRSAGSYPNGLPVFNILNPDGATLQGIPGDLTGVAGVVGSAARIYRGSGAWGSAYSRVAAGGAAGVGGGGLVIVCRGMAMGVAGEIDCSGTPGSTGSIASSSDAPTTDVRGQTGSGGFPGGILVLMDGDYSPPNFTNANITASRGDALMPGTVDVNLPDFTRVPQGQEAYGQNIGVDAFNYWQACTRVQYIPEAAQEFLWLPEDDRRTTNPRRALTDLLINNLVQNEFGAPAASFGPLTCGAHGNGQFVCAGLYVGGATEMYKSPEGKFWTAITGVGSASTDNLYKMVHKGGYFLGVGGNLVTTGTLMHSVDAETWTKNIPSGAAHLADVDFDGTTWVVVGNDDGTDADIYTATDPTGTWVERGNPKAYDLRAVCYVDFLDLWVAGGQSDGSDIYLITAADPTGTWTERSNPITTNSSINGIAAGNGIIVAVGSQDTSAETLILTSTDGETWTEVTDVSVANESFLSIQFIDGVFYAVGSYQSSTESSLIFMSEDGEKWWRVYNNAPNQLEEIIFDGATFVLPIGINPEGVMVSARVDTL